MPFITGLLALIVGALFNAYLVRRRDERLRQQAARALAAGLGAEYEALADALDDRFGILKLYADGALGMQSPTAFVHRLELPPLGAYGHAGQLPPQLAYRAAAAAQIVGLARCLLEASAVEVREGTVDRELTTSRVRAARRMASSLRDAARELVGEARVVRSHAVDPAALQELLRG